MLAEIAAKRAIIAAFAADDNSGRFDSCGDQCEWHALEYAIRVSAGAYAAHPDYRNEWRQ